MSTSSPKGVGEKHKVIYIENNGFLATVFRRQKGSFWKIEPYSPKSKCWLKKFPPLVTVLGCSFSQTKLYTWPDFESLVKWATAWWSWDTGSGWGQNPSQKTKIGVSVTCSFWLDLSLPCSARELLGTPSVFLWERQRAGITSSNTPSSYESYPR